MPPYHVKIDQLRVGVFVRLNLKWSDHPFLLNSFKLTKQSQIETLRELGVETVLCVPGKSDTLPVALAPAAVPLTQTRQDESETGQLWEMKRIRGEQLKKRSLLMAECERDFNTGVSLMKRIMNDSVDVSPELVAEADNRVCQLIERLSEDKDCSIQLVNTEKEVEGALYHALNVSLLSVLIGKQCGMDKAGLRVLGMGGLFHDIGKMRLPQSISKKNGGLTPVEAACFRLHPKYGEAILSKFPLFPKKALDIVLHHHELYNGIGYPDKLAGFGISLPARIVSIVNIYDNYCNNPQESLSPYEALSLMFSRDKELFDQHLLTAFIQCIGVYPPGTIVKLSTEHIAIVVATHQDAPLSPSVVVYDPDIPHEETLIFDLRDDPSVCLTGSIRPSRLDSRVCAYLRQSTKISYHIAASGSTGGNGGE